MKGEGVLVNAEKIPHLICAVILMAALALLIYGANRYKPVDGLAMLFSSLKFSLLPTILFLIYAAFAMKSSATPPQEFVLIMVLSLFGFVLFGFGTEYVLNGCLDKGISTTHSALVLNKYEKKHKGRRGKFSYTYSVKLESWRGPDKTERLTVPSGIYQRSIPQKTYFDIVTKPGKFGFEWINSYTLE